MKNRFEEIQSLYVLAKEQIHQLEAMGDDGLSVIAINQLRYVGEHILRASTAESDEAKEVELNKAEGHCWRAISDGVELGSIITLEKLKEFQKEYKGLPITEYIPEYKDIIELASNLQSLLVKSKKIDSREYYLQVNKYLPELIEKLSVIERTRDILHQELKSKQYATRSWLLGLILSIAISLLSGYLYEGLFVEKKKEALMQTEINNLAEIQKSLSSLQTYVSSQQNRLENLNNDISNLTQKREELENAVNVSEDTLQRLLQTYESKQSAFSALGIGISFVVGSLSSFFVVLLVSFLKRRKLIENT